MSNATTMHPQLREANYRLQNATHRGTVELTPRQTRRLHSKANESLRGHARTGRLRRRYDRVDVRHVKRIAAYVVGRQIAAKHYQDHTRKAKR